MSGALAGSRIMIHWLLYVHADYAVRERGAGRCSVAFDAPKAASFSVIRALARVCDGPVSKVSKESGGSGFKSHSRVDPSDSN